MFWTHFRSYVRCSLWHIVQCTRITNLRELQLYSVSSLFFFFSPISPFASTISSSCLHTPDTQIVYFCIDTRPLQNDDDDDEWNRIATLNSRSRFVCAEFVLENEFIFAHRIEAAMSERGEQKTKRRNKFDDLYGRVCLSVLCKCSHFFFCVDSCIIHLWSYAFAFQETNPTRKTMTYHEKEVNFRFRDGIRNPAAPMKWLNVHAVEMNS